MLCYLRYPGRPLKAGERAANSAILDDHLFSGSGPRRRPAEVIALVDEEDLPENHRSR